MSSERGEDRSAGIRESSTQQRDEKKGNVEARDV